MYRVTYQIDKHTATILMLSVKNGDSWSQLNNEKLESQILEKLSKTVKTYDVDSAFGEAHFTENLTFITGTIDIKK